MRLDLSLQDLDRIVADDADIGEPPCLDREQQPSDAGTVHVDSQIVPLGMSRRQRREMLAVAEADLDRSRCVAAEQGVEVQRARVELQAVPRPQQLQCALLGLGNSPAAGYK